MLRFQLHPIVLFSAFPRRVPCWDEYSGIPCLGRCSSGYLQNSGYHRIAPELQICIGPGRSARQSSGEMNLKSSSESSLRSSRSDARCLGGVPGNPPPDHPRHPLSNGGRCLGESGGGYPGIPPQTPAIKKSVLLLSKSVFVSLLRGVRGGSTT